MNRRRFLEVMGAGALAPAVHRRVSQFQERRAAVSTTGSSEDFSIEAGLAYLNTGTLGPSPRAVIDRMVEVLRLIESNPHYHVFNSSLRNEMDDVVRKAAAGFLGCDTNELALTDNTTVGMNGVATGIALGPGDRVLTTNQEHEGGLNGWTHLARTRGVVIDEVALSPGVYDHEEIVSRFAQRLTRRTRVVSVSHVTTVSGQVLPIMELAGLAHAHDCLLVVDGAQAAGAIPVNVRQLGCDAYVTAGHKWLLGPKGTGLLYLSDAAQKRVEPVFLEGGRFDAYTGATGTRNIAAFAGLAAALAYLTRAGRTSTEQHNVTLRNRLYEMLQSVPRISIVSPPPGEAAGPMVTFLLPDRIDNADFRDRLRERHHIQVKNFPRANPNGIRISTHLFNDSDQMERLVKALRLELS